MRSQPPISCGLTSSPPCSADDGRAPLGVATMTGRCGVAEPRPLVPPLSAGRREHWTGREMRPMRVQTPRRLRLDAQPCSIPSGPGTGRVLGSCRAQRRQKPAGTAMSGTTRAASPHRAWGSGWYLGARSGAPGCEGQLYRNMLWETCADPPVDRAHVRAACTRTSSYPLPPRGLRRVFEAQHARIAVVVVAGCVHRRRHGSLLGACGCSHAYTNAGAPRTAGLAWLICERARAGRDEPRRSSDARACRATPRSVAWWMRRGLRPLSADRRCG
jgi:hypothetical protein